MLNPKLSAAPLAQNPFEAEWILELKPSRWISGFLLLTHSLAILTLLLLPIDLWIKVMASFGLLSSAFYYVAKHQAYWPPLAVSALKWREWGGWELYTLDGKRHAVQLLPNSYSSAMISILNFRSLKARRFTVVLTPDLLPTEKARHLKRRLNILH